MICRYFLAFGRLPFLLLLFLFAVQIFSLMYSHLSIFAFVAFPLVSSPKKPLPSPMSRCLLPMFSSRTFIVLAFTFKSFVDFELIFYMV